jgi:hypothetical protein
MQTLTLKSYLEQRGVKRESRVTNRTLKMTSREVIKAVRKIPSIIAKREKTIAEKVAVAQINTKEYALKSSASRWIKNNTEKHPNVTFTIVPKGDSFIVTN